MPSDAPPVPLPAGDNEKVVNGSKGQILGTSLGILGARWVYPSPCYEPPPASASKVAPRRCLAMPSTGGDRELHSAQEVIIGNRSLEPPVSSGLPAFYLHVVYCTDKSTPPSVSQDHLPPIQRPAGELEEAAERGRHHMMREAGVELAAPAASKPHQRDAGEDRGGGVREGAGRGPSGQGKGGADPGVCDRCRGISLFTKEMKDRWRPYNAKDTTVPVALSRSIIHQPGESGPFFAPKLTDLYRNPSMSTWSSLLVIPSEAELGCGQAARPGHSC